MKQTSLTWRYYLGNSGFSIMFCFKPCKCGVHGMLLEDNVELQVYNVIMLMTTIFQMSLSISRCSGIVAATLDVLNEIVAALKQ